MAFMTLKRSLEWEPQNQHSVKRRRYNPIDESAGSDSLVCVSSFAGAVDGFAVSLLNPQSSSSRYGRGPQTSVFTGIKPSIISPDNKIHNIRDEIKRLRRYKKSQLSSGALEPMQVSEPIDLEIVPDSPPHMTRNPDKPLFTFKQVQMICERMLKDQEEELRKNYEDVLNTKLAEQYDTFVKFTYDQIHKCYAAAPSYLS